MRFDDVWMPGWQLDRLARLAADSCGKGAVIEIGVHQGLSAIPIARAIYPNVLHAVDHWLGSTDFTRPMIERDNYSTFLSNIAEGTRGNIQIHKRDWHYFAMEWSGSVGFMHLDAEHTEDEVSAQIDQFMPYMVSGSIIAGDDYNWPEVRMAVYKHFKHSQVHVLWNKLWWVEFV